MKEFNKTQELRKIKFKQNKNTYIKRISIILSCVILVIGVLYFTFAKFESNKSYTLINGRVSNMLGDGDLNIAVMINGEKASSFPPKNSNFELRNVSCKDNDGDVEFTYDKNTYGISIPTLNSKTTCTYYFVETQSVDFEYTGNYQEYMISKSGTYRIELWGASSSPRNPNESKGGYVSGESRFNSGDKLYVYVGVSSNADTSKNYTFNGSTYYRYGNGSADVRYFGNNYEPNSSDLEWNSTLGINSRIIVAGAAGVDGYKTYGGAAGGLSAYSGGSSGSCTGGGGATQTSGGGRGGSCLVGTPGAGGFGVGGYSPRYSNGSYYEMYGGSGYYGGGGASAEGQNYGSGGGGSSFISGHTGCVAITSSSSQSPRTGTNGATCSTGTSDNLCSVHYSGIKFTNTKMIDGLGYSWTNTSGAREAMPKPEGGYYSDGVGHNGNGYARITYLGE